MIAIKNILLFVSAATALIPGKRDTSTILSDISTINSNVKVVTSAVNSYNGALLAAIRITKAESTLETSIKQGTSDAQAASQRSSTDSNTIIAAIMNLTPDIQAALTTVVNKKPQFAAAGLTSTVQGDLGTLKADTDDFANALIAMTSGDTKTQANAEKATIDTDFQNAINAFM